MSDRRIDAFFYGLYMDLEILRESGVAPINPRRAYVDDFALRIGRRATLLPSSGARSYGMLFALTHSELDRLYAAPGLEQYRPEAVLAQPLSTPASMSSKIGSRLEAVAQDLDARPTPHCGGPGLAVLGPTAECARWTAILREHGRAELAGYQAARLRRELMEARGGKPDAGPSLIARASGGRGRRAGRRRGD
jgi:hypothetical protein